MILQDLWLKFLSKEGKKSKLVVSLGLFFVVVSWCSACAPSSACKLVIETRHNCLIDTVVLFLKATAVILQDLWLKFLTKEGKQVKRNEL